MLSRSALFLFAVSTPSFLIAQTSTPLPPSPLDGPAFSLSAAAIRTASAAVAYDKLSDVTILYEEADYRIAPAGTLSYSHRLIYRLETPRSVENWAEISLDWDPWYQTPSQLHARVLSSSGAFVELDQKTITDAPLNTNQEDGTYTTQRVRKAPLPGLAVGSIVEEVVSEDETRPYFAGGSVYRYAFTDGAPTEREKVVVDVPANVPFKDHVANLAELAVTRTEAGGMRRIVYELSHHAATVDGDIDLASTTTPEPTVEFSTGASWAAVAQSYGALSDAHIVLEQVTGLLPATPPSSRLATIQQLVKRLHKEVRYTGIEFNEAQLTPQSPAEVLKRHYGDCKDKATLLVTLLRAAHIPADLALLASGFSSDVNPDLPGMNRFNHAIVYVPAAGSEPALWIDATAEFNAVGTLPEADAGRLALIIAPDTSALTMIPAAVPEDSMVVETREFTLGEIGPAHVVETSETTGHMDASYRSEYGGAANKKVKDNLEQYVQTAYTADSLAGMTHGESTDLSQPFKLTLTVDGARRGSTSLTDAAVAIFPTNTLNGLPKWIRTAPVPLPDNATAEQKQDRALAEAQRSPTYEISPFITEQRYRIHAPAGFTVRGLPPDRTTAIGPGTLTEHYAVESPTLVTATLRFTTGKAVVTTQEALAMRQAVAEASRRETILIGFDQTGAKLLSDGKIKEALVADQAAIAANPNSALAHVRLARALLAVGVGDMARTEAARAVELEPKSAAALLTQGWVLEHDLLGERFGLGYDRAGAIAAFKKAVPLNSEDFDPRLDLAILYEFTNQGGRYVGSPNLADALALYRNLIETELKKNSNQVPQYRLNLAYSLLFHHDYKELDALLQDIPVGINHSTLAIASAVAQKDATAGIAAADHLNVSVDDRNKGLVSAGNYLAQLGLYPQASAMLAAGLQGQKDAPTIAQQVELFKNLHRVPVASPPATSAEAMVFNSLNLAITGGDRKAMAAVVTPHAYLTPGAFERDLDKGMQSAGMLHGVAANSGMSEVVLRDIILGGMTIKATGDDAAGYRVLTQFIGGQNSNIFVVREDGAFRVVADGDHDTAQVGAFVLYALDHNEAGVAKSILDWRRDLMHKGGGDDALSGPLLPRFWTVGSTREGADSPEAMRVAAASLLMGSMGIKPLLDGLAPLRDKAAGARQTDLDLLLAEGYLGVEQPAAALPYIAHLLDAEPDSVTAQSLAGQAYAQSGDFKGWQAMLAPLLAKKPGDPDLLRARTRMLIAQHDFAGARAALKPVFDSGHVTSSDYNLYAWLGLFDDQLGPDITDAAQHANMASKNSSFADLHTMACVYAAQGRVTEAQQVLAQAIKAANLSQPNSAVWYALGLLYENYGLRDAALAAYGRVKAHEFDDHTFVDAGSTYLLAQKGVARLGGGMQPQGSAARR